MHKEHTSIAVNNELFMVHLLLIHVFYLGFSLYIDLKNISPIKEISSYSYSEKDFIEN